MNQLAGILATVFSLIVVQIATLIGNIVNGRTPAWVRRWAQTAGRVAEVTAAIAFLYLALSALLVVTGIKYNNPVTMYVGFVLLTVFSLSAKALVGICEKLAKPIMATFGFALNRVGLHLTQIDLGVQETLTDISMCLLMCGVFALDGRDIGLTLACVSWVSLASLIAMIIMAEAQITIRRRLMVMFVAIFALAHVAFDLSPATKEVVSAAVENTQVGQRRVADVVRPNMPLAEVQIHQDTEQTVLKSELARYIAEVQKFERAAAKHTPTPGEIEAYQNAMKNVATVREALKLRNPEKSTWVANTWLSGYALFTILFLGFGVWLVIFISSRIPKGGAASVATQGTSASPATPAPAASAAAVHVPHASSKISFWHVFAVAAVVAAVVLAIMFYNKIGSTQASNLPPAPAPVVVVQPPAPASVEVRHSIVFSDPRYLTAAERKSEQLASDTADGEFRFWVSAQDQKYDLPMLPTLGQTWEFSFSDTLVCAFNITCTGPAGQGGRASELQGNDRATYNADDFPFQNVHYQEAVLSTGDGILGLGGLQSWQVTNAAAGKTASVGFNIRKSEANRARGGGVLTIRVKK